MNAARYDAGTAGLRMNPPPRWVPPEAGEGWLIGATTVDCLVAPLVGAALVVGVLHYSISDLIFGPAVVGCALAVSFVNHVLGTVLLRGSLGKLVFGLRVVRATNGRRSGFWRAVGRWLLGFVYLGVMMAVEDGGGIGEAAGLRVIRRRDERQ
ncbi:RDD family protein [Nocardia testacea]|uniref:RDD family protein n=1 Tax=Nocardia testacea TaxID=248551 RepID=UPI003C2CE2EA